MPPPHPGSFRRARRALAFAAALCAATGCVTRSVRETVFDEEMTEVVLRHESRRGEPVDAGYAHPAEIAPVRIAHVLSRIDLREGKGGSERRPAIPTDLLQRIAEGVSVALARATPAQEVAVLAIRRTKRFGVFDRYYLTSFVTYTKGEQLYVHLSRSDWEVPRQKLDRLPQPRAGKHPRPFRVIPSQGMALVDRQSVAVDWRHSVFARPTRVRITPTGEVVRRTILMESPEPAAAGGAAAPPPEGLSPTALRRLADLEEQRMRGQITEAEYDSRRLEILRSEAPPP